MLCVFASDGASARHCSAASSASSSCPAPRIRFASFASIQAGTGWPAATAAFIWRRCSRRRRSSGVRARLHQGSFTEDAGAAAAWPTWNHQCRVLSRSTRSLMRTGVPAAVSAGTGTRMVPARRGARTVPV